MKECCDKEPIAWKDMEIRTGKGLLRGAAVLFVGERVTVDRYFTMPKSV